MSFVNSSNTSERIKSIATLEDTEGAMTYRIVRTDASNNVLQTYYETPAGTVIRRGERAAVNQGTSNEGFVYVAGAGVAVLSTGTMTSGGWISLVNGNLAADTHSVVVIKRGSVVVNYVDEDGNVIKNPVTPYNNEVSGTPYTTVPNRDQEISYNGKVYQYVRVDSSSANEVGNIPGGNTYQVTYVYRLKPATLSPADPSSVKSPKTGY